MLEHLFGRRDQDTTRRPVLSVEPLEGRVNPVAFYVVPGAEGTATALDFAWLERKAAFFNEIGVYRVDDGTGAVGGVAPTDPGYAQAALANATTVFTRGQSKGARAVQAFEAGSTLGFYLVQSSTRELAQLLNPSNQPGAGPVTFFSFTGASPGGFDHAQMAVNGTETVVRWEDVLGGGDRDFDDAVIRVRAAVPTVVPGATGQVTPTTFRLNQREAAFRSEIGVYAFDDASGAVDGVAPGDPGYAAAVMRSARRTALFGPAAGAGAVAGANLPSGGTFGFYMIQGGTAEAILAVNPGNSPAGFPVAFFSQSNANPDGTVHVRQDGNTFYFEDGLNGGDQDFNDAVVSFVYGPPVGAPAPRPVPPAPADPTSPGPGDPTSPPPAPDTTAPVVSVRLTTDTADPNRPATAGDGVTNTLGVTGTATDAGGVAALEARLGTTGAFVSIFDALAGDTFALDAARLAALNGGVPLPTGSYTLQVRATDRSGNASDPVAVAFTFDLTTNATLLLDEGSDTGVQGEFRTETATVRLRGVAEAGATVRLESRAVGSAGTVLATTTADATGAFAFDNLPLAAGPNGFRVVVTDAAGNVGTAGATVTRNLAPTAPATPTAVAGAAGGTQVIDLNTVFADAETYARVTTNLPGNATFFVQLFTAATPNHATNFQAYANGDRYDNSFIHRSVPGFVVQGGGFTVNTPVVASVQAATWAAGTATIDTATPHGLRNGQRVTVAGVDPAGFNGTFTVTVLDADTFTYTLPADPGAFVAGGTTTGPNFATVGGLFDVANATWGAGTATITTSAPHGLAVGQTVSVQDVAPGGYNGTFVVTAAGVNTFSYVLAADPGLYVSGGTVAPGVPNEPGLPNSRGTIALAKQGGNTPGAASSGTNQFFFNLADNSRTVSADPANNTTADLDNQNGGFTVFAQVVGNGQATVDAIAGLPTRNFAGTNGAFDTVPVQNNALGLFPNATAADLATITDVAVLPNALTYSNITSSDPNVVTTAFDPATGNLTFNFVAAGTATVSVTATDPDGATVTHTFNVTVTP